MRNHVHREWVAGPLEYVATTHSARHVECFMRSRSIHAEKSKAIHIPPGHMPVRMSTLSVRSTAQRIAPRVHVPRELSVVLTPNRNDTYLSLREAYIFRATRM